MSRYIDAERLRAEIESRKEAILSCPENGIVTFEAKSAIRSMAKGLLSFIDSLQQDETQVDKILCSQVWWEEQGWIMIPPNVTIDGIDSLLKQVRKKLQQEQPEGQR